MRIPSTNASPGGRAPVAIEMDTRGNEVGASFTLRFDPSKLRNPQVTLGSDAPADAVLTVNTKQTADGKLGILVDSGAALSKQIVTVTFDVAKDAAGGATPIRFTDDLARKGTSDANGQKLATTYEDGSITISGAASSAFKIAGRILTPEGAGLRNATVTITGANGFTRTVVTSSFGYYTFGDIPAGGDYTLTVASRRYRFAARTVSVGADLSDIDFTAIE